LQAELDGTLILHALFPSSPIAGPPTRIYQTCVFLQAPNFQARRHSASARASCVPCTCMHLEIIGRLGLAALCLEPCTIHQDQAPACRTRYCKVHEDGGFCAEVDIAHGEVSVDGRRDTSPARGARSSRRRGLQSPAEVSALHTNARKQQAGHCTLQTQLISLEQTGFPPGPHEQRWSAGTPARHCSIWLPVVAHTRHTANISHPQ